MSDSKAQGSCTVFSRWQEMQRGWKLLAEALGQRRYVVELEVHEPRPADGAGVVVLLQELGLLLPVQVDPGSGFLRGGRVVPFG